MKPFKTLYQRYLESRKPTHDQVLDSKRKFKGTPKRAPRPRKIKLPKFNQAEYAAMCKASEERNYETK